MFAFVKQSVAISVNDIPVSISEGDVWDAADPVVKAYPAFFSDAPIKVLRSVPVKAAKKTAASK
jgi:hypothetical protein